MPHNFPRILLKLSGESLSHDGSGLSTTTTHAIAEAIATVNRAGIALAIVIGGGNIWRFRNNEKAKYIPRERSDYLGMMATVMNGAVLAAALRDMGIDAEVFSAIPAPEVIRPYTIDAARDVLTRGGVAICAGGTGRPYVTTDTASAFRAVELGCERVLKATNVDGVYDADPRTNPDAKLYADVTFEEVIEKKLGVMDATAFALLAEYRIPITVFNFEKDGLLIKAAKGEKVGTIIS